MKAELNTYGYKPVTVDCSLYKKTTYRINKVRKCGKRHNLIGALFYKQKDLMTNTYKNVGNNAY